MSGQTQSRGRKRAPKKILTGTPLEELWQEDEPDQEAKLETMQELAKKLKRMGLLDRRGRTLYEWSKRGCSSPHNKSVRYVLRSQPIGRYEHSSVRWVREFLLEMRQPRRS